MRTPAIVLQKLLQDGFKKNEATSAIEQSGGRASRIILIVIIVIIIIIMLHIAGCMDQSLQASQCNNQALIRLDTPLIKNRCFVIARIQNL